jgi:CubicO group peptidase (beta-lactamase class C family)
MKKAIVLLLAFFISVHGDAQKMWAFADSIRRTHHIPELGYAVVTSEGVLELEVLGVRKIKTQLRAERTDRFRIGSNTKAITSFIAAQLVEQRKIAGNANFFDFFPEMKEKSRPEYFGLTLIDLLSFRTRLISYTYTNRHPTRDQFSGDEQAQRRQFVAWCLQQPPATNTYPYYVSNPDYVAAALMLEKASGKSFEELVQELGRDLGISFGFGQPNSRDSNQPWGHNAKLVPEPPGDSYKLSWLEAAGNINVSLPDYAVFIQEQLKGLQGKSRLLPKSEFNTMHFGFSGFAVGWFWDRDKADRRYSYNVGNPGSFLSKVYVFPGDDRAFILFANAQTDEADEGLAALYAKLRQAF